MSIKLVSINVERSKHLDRVRDFLEREKPDIVCMQELVDTDCEYFAQTIGAFDYFYVAEGREIENGESMISGTGLFSRYPLHRYGVAYYFRTNEKVPCRIEDPATFNNAHRAIVWADCVVDSDVYRIATTHLTWTPGGSVTDQQRTDTREMLKELSGMGELVFCGDFNAPRGNEIFSQIASLYTDNIPAHYKTSIDVNLHRNGKTRPRDFDDKMVDGLFSTPGYRVADVELVDGVSDHCGIVATISKIGS